MSIGVVDPKGRRGLILEWTMNIFFKGRQGLILKEDLRNNEESFLDP